MRALLLSGLVALIAGCTSRYETLRPAAGPAEPAIQAIVQAPGGAGPFPVLVVLHGCAGPRPNGERWAAEARAIGFMTAIPDQYGPLGVEQTCTSTSGFRLWERARATHSLLRLLQQRPDVRPDRVFVMGFSQGGILAVGTATSAWDSQDPPWAPSDLPRPAGAIALYPLCSYWPAAPRAPLLLLLPALDDWTPPVDCEDWARAASGVPRPRIVLLPGAHHAFDEPETPTPRFVAGFSNVFRSSGFGATIGYNANAHEEARREVRAFLESLL
jgi:dienelactone hydrolase